MKSIIREICAYIFGPVIAGTEPPTRVSYMNIYAQGYYHRTGKEHTLNCHPGDLYDTEAEAIADIDPEAPYIATVGFEWEPHGYQVRKYAKGSTPVPLSVSRKWFKKPEPVGTLELVRQKYSA